MGKKIKSHHILCVLFTLLIICLFIRKYIAHSARENEYKLCHAGSYIKLMDVKQNLSGLTYNPDEGIFYAIINSPPEIVLMNRNYRIIKRIKLEGFEDTEGIEWVALNKYLIIEERKRKINLVQVNNNNIQILSSFTLSLGGKLNAGFEGIAYDINSDAIYIANEKKPSHIYKIDNFITNPRNLKVTLFYKSAIEIAGLSWDSQKKSLIALSEEEKMIMSISEDGILSSMHKLNKYFKKAAQPEGVHIYNDTIFIVGEPNHIYEIHICKSD